jgi:hypothetical protein
MPAGTVVSAERGQGIFRIIWDIVVCLLHEASELFTKNTELIVPAPDMEWYLDNKLFEMRIELVTRHAVKYLLKNWRLEILLFCA